MREDARREERHRLARQAHSLLLLVGGVGIGPQRRDMVEDVLAALAPHHRDDDRRAALDREHRARVAHVRRAAEEFRRHVGLRHAQVGQDRERAARVEPLLDVDERARAAAVQHLDVAVLALHPRVDLRVALLRRDGDERQAVFRHRPRGHVPVAGVRHHDDDALAFVDVGLELVLVVRAVLDVAVHPRAVEARRTDHLDAGLEDVGEAEAGDAAQLRGAFRGEDAAQALHRPRALEAEDVGREPAEERGEAHRHAVGNQAHDPAEEAERAVFQVDRELAFRCHGE